MWTFHYSALSHFLKVRTNCGLVSFFPHNSGIWMCLNAHTCICLCDFSHMYGPWARVCFLFRPHPVISVLLSLSCSVLAVAEAGLESKVQVCRLADESQRGSVPFTVCKYVVTLIERSSSSQPLSFVPFWCVCVCLCVFMTTAGVACGTFIQRVDSHTETQVHNHTSGIHLWLFCPISLRCLSTAGSVLVLQTLSE